MGTKDGSNNDPTLVTKSSKNKWDLERYNGTIRPKGFISLLVSDKVQLETL
jgi:hypothetical protein